jgi:hypothetical protein
VEGIGRILISGANPAFVWGELKKTIKISIKNNQHMGRDLIPKPTE